MSKTPSSPTGKGSRPAKGQRPAKSNPARSKAAPAPGDTSSGPDGDRIAKVLSRAGLASRREAERMIADGRVEVNGKVIDSPALNVVVGKDRIVVDGKQVEEPEPPRLWLYHKPAGLVTTTSDELDRKTIFDDLPEDLPRVMTVGRLDLNSEGLLLLTNDGGIKRQLELPSTGWLRRYRVRINGRPQDSDFEPLRKGLVIEGEKFQPMIVTLDRQQGANAWLTVGLREGKNREIRRAMEDIGFSVNRLLRLSYGPFQLGQLKPGEVEELRPRVVRDQLGLAAPEEEQDSQKRPGTRQRPMRGKPGTRPGSGQSDRDTDSRAGAGRTGRPGSAPNAKGTGKGTGKPLSKAGGKSMGKPTGRPGARSSDKAVGNSGPKGNARPSGKSFGAGRADSGKRGGGSSAPSGSRGPGKPPRR